MWTRGRFRCINFFLETVVVLLVAIPNGGIFRGKFKEEYLCVCVCVCVCATTARVMMIRCSGSSNRSLAVRQLVCVNCLGVVEQVNLALAKSDQVKRLSIDIARKFHQDLSLPSKCTAVGCQHNIDTESPQERIVFEDRRGERAPGEQTKPGQNRQGVNF